VKFLIIIPTHNEEKNILFTLKSLQKQTFQNFFCIVVNDGSTDKTIEVVEDFIRHQSSTRYLLKNLDYSTHEPGAKVVRTFNKGLESIDLSDFDILYKFDADVIFPSDYLKIMFEVP